MNTQLTKKSKLKLRKLIIEQIPVQLFDEYRYSQLDNYDLNKIKIDYTLHPHTNKRFNGSDTYIFYISFHHFAELPITINITQIMREQKLEEILSL